MNRSQLVSVVVVGMTLVALGVAATSLETTLTTDPDDELNPNWEALPIDEEVAAAIQDEMNEQDQDHIGTSGTDDSADDGATEPETELSPTGSEPAIELGPGPFTVTEPGHEPPPEEELPLRSLLPWGLGLLVVLLAVGSVVYRSSGETLPVLDPESTEHGDSTTAAPAGQAPQAISRPSVEWPDGEPTTIVDRAWVQMVEQLGVDQPTTATPAECIEQAKETEADRQAVEAIATAFEAVHYGGGPASEGAADAQEALGRLDGANK